MSRASFRSLSLLALVALAVALPALLRWVGADFYLSFASRVLVYALAASSLNLLLGYGGLVSLGHAAFMGLGAYTTGVLLFEGQGGAGTHVLATVAVCAGAALPMGLIALRTRGVYFIMITLALAQMLYYLANSAKGYGGDEGLTLRVRSALPLGLSLRDPATFYWLALAALAACLWALQRFAASPLGRAVQTQHDDETRAKALGLPVAATKLALYVVAAAICGLAGAFSVNLQGYVSPAQLHWTQSGTLMVMVILGGAGRVWGGVLGAAALLLLEEALSAQTVYWEFWTGAVLLAVVLLARNGLSGLFDRWASKGPAS